VSHLSYYVFFLGVALEGILAYRLIKGALWRYYPFFAFYIAYVAAQSIIGIAILQSAPGAYPVWFWRIGVGNICLRFLVIWEVFRHTFPKASPLRRMVTRQFTIGVLALSTVLSGMLWAIEIYGKSHSVYLAMERSFGFVQAVLVLTVLILARYYHLAVGRNIWGIAVAFGMYSSLSTAASALVDLAHSSFFPFWYFLSPLSVVAMLSLWTWALWIYAPNPIPNADTLIDATGDFDRWPEDWGRAISTVRKVMHP